MHDHVGANDVVTQHVRQDLAHNQGPVLACFAEGPDPQVSFASTLRRKEPLRRLEDGFHLDGGVSISYKNKCVVIHVLQIQQPNISRLNCNNCNSCVCCEWNGGISECCVCIYVVSKSGVSTSAASNCGLNNILLAT